MEKDNIITKIVKEVKIIIDESSLKSKMQNACFLNQLEHDNISSKEYVRAITDIKKAMGLKHTIYELFVF